MSVFKQHSLSLNEDLDVPFLKNWIIAFSKDGERHIKKWNLPSNKITRDEFVVEFNKQYFPYGEPEFGGHGVMSRLRVRNLKLLISNKNFHSLQNASKTLIIILFKTRIYL